MCSWNHWIVIKDECVMIPWWNWEKWKIVDNVFLTLNLKNGILQHPRQVKIYIPVFCFIICSIRPWDYPEHFGICSQLDKKK